MTQRTLEDTGSNPRAGGKKNKYSSPPADPSVKRVPGLVLGEQSTPIVSHCTTNGTGGNYRVPTPAVGGIVGTSCELLAFLCVPAPVCVSVCLSVYCIVGLASTSL